MERKKTAVALGLFDGVHLGHRAVIRRPAELAAEGYIPAAFTFRSGTLPVKRGSGLEYIYGDDYKEKLIRSLGVGEIFSEDFGELRDLSGEDFAREILSRRLNAGVAVCGSDFRFGRNALCGVRELAELGEKYGFRVEVAEDVSADGERISSRRIRELLKKGDAEGAAALLGADYAVYGRVVDGNRVGRTIDFPTVNQLFGEETLVPLYGVYASAVTIDGREYPAVTNIGVKPTIAGERAPLAETHILGFSGDLYGATLETRIKKFIRGERRFPSLEALKEQIRRDIESANI